MYKEKILHSPWITGLLFALWFLVIPPIIAIILIILRNKELKKFQNMWVENGFEEILENKEQVSSLKEELQNLSNKKQEIEKKIEEYKPINDLFEVKDKISEQINDLSEKSEALSKKVSDIQMLLDIEESKQKVTNEIESLNNNKQVIVEEVNSLQEEVILLKDEFLMQSFGFTNPKYGFESSEVYQNKLNDIRKEQKQLVKERTATNHSLDWTIGNDKKKGREFILDTIKLTLRAFNNECDNIIGKVKYNNIEASEKRIRKVFEDLNKLTDMQRVTITSLYLNLKIEELYLKYEFE